MIGFWEKLRTSERTNERTNEGQSIAIGSTSLSRWVQKLKWLLRRSRQKLARWSIKKLMHQSGESSQMPACFGYTCYILPKHNLVNLDTKATIEKTYISLKERVRSKHVPERKWGRIRDQPYSLLRHTEKRRKWSPPVIPPSHFSVETLHNPPHHMSRHVFGKSDHFLHFLTWRIRKSYPSQTKVRSESLDTSFRNWKLGTFQRYFKTSFCKLWVLCKEYCQRGEWNG